MWQTVIVLIIVGLALFFVGRRMWRSARAKAGTGCGCGCDGSGKQPKPIIEQ